SAPTACRNCGQALQPAMRYCPACGQSTALHPPSAREFVHEFIGHYVALEGTLWRTLALLCAKPGQLTVHYLAGRKLRYVNPLRLYLTVSLVVFLVGRLVGAAPEVQVGSSNAQMREQIAHSKGVLMGAVSDDGRVTGAELFNDGTFTCTLHWGWLCDRLKVRMQQMKAEPKTAISQGMGHFRDNLPYAMFVLMPLFALLTKAVYLRRGLVYGEHLVFALHVHTAWFVLALAALLLPASVSDVPVVIAPVYALLAMQRVYGGRWWATLLRGVAVALPYLVAVAVVLAAVAIIAILS
ncbi:MAG: DUF3667 domain-containing protein, partial [Betaproteobacteria bacterium]|nr:DUF3667 domain-containing protein [Betaproteobacteria bacterium]